MSLLNDASLILVPSAIKTGELLVQKPLPNKFADETGNYDGNDPQGSANLTFTRASDATRVNADGLVEKVRTNLILQSNQFDTTWSANVGASVTSGQSGYDGSSNAWLLNTNAAGSQLVQSKSVSGVHTLSVYAKAGTYDFCRVLILSANTAFTDFDLANGTIGTSDADTIDATITSVGGGWYRLTLTASDSAITAVRLYAIVADNDITGTSGNIYIQNAMLEQGLVATGYIPTTTSARSTFAGITVDGTSVPNVPRLDYSGGATCPSLLLEPQTTALNQFSEQLDNAYWGLSRASAFGSGSIVNAVTSPDGYQNADYIQQASGQTVGGGAFRNILSSTGNYTLSVFAKKGEQRYLRLGGAFAASGVSLWCNFDLETGTIGTPDSGITPKIEAFSNGWYRCSITASKVDLTGQAVFIYQANTLNGSDVTPLSGLYLWGVNVTQTSYLQSYVPTLGSAVTRLADSAYGAGTSSTFNDSEGVLFVEMSSLQDGRLAVKNSDGSDQVIFGTTNGNVFYRIRENNINIFTEFSGVSGRVNRKIALKYKSADTSIFVDGVKYNLNTSTYTLAGLNEFLFTSEGNATYGNIKQTTYFPTALTDAQLTELTTL